MILVNLKQRILVLALILLPFNGLPYFSGVFGELSGEGAFYPLLFLTGLYIASSIQHRNIRFPRNLSAYLAIAFFLIAILTSLANFYPISEAFNKGRSGIEKFTFQFFVLIFAYLVLFASYSIFRVDNGFRLVRIGALLSLPIPLAVGCLEILAIQFDIEPANFVLSLLDPWIRESMLDSAIYSRVRGVSGESSFFSMYALFVFPWLLTEHISHPKMLTRIALLLLLLMAVFSLSRVAYVGIFIEISIIYLLYKQSKILRRSITYVLFLLAFGVFLFQGDLLASRSLTNTEDNLSNISRYASQAAALDIAVSHPLGVGLGQFGFYAKDHYPLFASNNVEVDLWASSTAGSPWPPVHSLYARILAEIGWVGLVAWLALWFVVLARIWKNQRIAVSHSKNMALDYLALFVSLIGVLLGGFNADSFRFMPYWVLLALAWSSWKLQPKKTTT